MAGTSRKASDKALDKIFEKITSEGSATLAIATATRSNNGKELSEKRYVDVGSKMADRYGKMFASSGSRMATKK